MILSGWWRTLARLIASSRRHKAQSRQGRRTDRHAVSQAFGERHDVGLDVHQDGVGDEEDTLSAGNFLFERGYYVQSVTFPAVPYHAGVLRIQVNANHMRDAIDGLLQNLAELKRLIRLPGPEELQRQAA